MTNAKFFWTPPLTGSSRGAHTSCHLVEKSNFQKFYLGGAARSWEVGEIVKKAYKDQHNGNFPTTPPTYLGRIAKAMWRRVLPVLEQQSVIERIDANLVENYCSAYEIYREAYESIKKDGVQQAIYRSAQNSSVINIFS